MKPASSPVRARRASCRRSSGAAGSESRTSAAGGSPAGGRAGAVEKLGGKTGYVTLVRLQPIPVLPMSALNVACGVARVPFGTYVAAAMVGVGVEVAMAMLERDPVDPDGAAEFATSLFLRGLPQ